MQVVKPRHTLLDLIAEDASKLSKTAVMRASTHHTAVAGGEAEAQAAYDEAVNAVFNLQLECHRHAQPHKSKKDGKIKWAMIEMWPIIVSIHLVSPCSVKLSHPKARRMAKSNWPVIVSIHHFVFSDVMLGHTQSLLQCYDCAV